MERTLAPEVHPQASELGGQERALDLRMNGQPQDYVSVESSSRSKAGFQFRECSGSPRTLHLIECSLEAHEKCCNVVPGSQSLCHHLRKASPAQRHMAERSGSQKPTLSSK